LSAAAAAKAAAAADETQKMIAGVARGDSTDFPISLLDEGFPLDNYRVGEGFARLP
jgi:hypothetical protein